MSLTGESALSLLGGEGGGEVEEEKRRLREEKKHVMIGRRRDIGGRRCRCRGVFRWPSKAQEGDRTTVHRCRPWAEENWLFPATTSEVKLGNRGNW